MKNSSDEIKRLHEEATLKKAETYIDPTTGYLVFTEIFLKKRGFCCQSGCRHCPWNETKKILTCPTE